MRRRKIQISTDNWSNVGNISPASQITNLNFESYTFFNFFWHFSQIWYETSTYRQIDSSTIDGNVEFVHSQYSCNSDVTSVNSVFVSDKIINNSDYFRIKCLSCSKVSSIWCVLFFCLYTFLFNLGKQSKISFFLLYLTLMTSCIIDPLYFCTIGCPI